MIRDLFERLRSTASANKRKELMKTALEGDQRELIISIFQDCYGPAKYNITSPALRSDLEEGVGCIISNSVLTIDENYNVFHELLEKLTNREYTGSFAFLAVRNMLYSFVPEDREILLGIIDKNLKVGFSLEQLNKLQGKKKKEFEVSLAYNLDDVKGVDPIDGTYFASRKLDGCRCVCFVETAWDEDGKGVHIVSEPIFKSRQNKEFTTLDNLKEPMRGLALNYHLVGKLVFDGEVCILDENGDEHFDWIMKEIRRKNHTIANPCYNIFDVVTQEEFEGEVESPDFNERDFSLTVVFSKYYTGIGMNDYPKRIKLLKQELIKSQEDFDRWSGYVTEGHWEGFMLRKDAPYKSGRTKDLLKVKKFKDAEYVVEGVDYGTAKYNTEVLNVVRSIQITHRGNRVDVGSGLSKEQRVEWFKDPSKIIGKTVTIQYFEETQDQAGNYSLRFPVLKYVYEGERDV